MAEAKVILTARFKAKAGKEEEVEQILMSLLEPTNKEEGCLFYYLHKIKDDTGHFFFYEGYKDQAAFDAHVAKPYVQAFLSRTDELCAEAPDIKFLDRVG